jgi:pantetheine-phosphate adenylyltransferase
MPSVTAVYAGSFDPPTLGHLDLIERAAKLFKRVIVAIAMNNEKASLFTVEERLEMLREAAGRFPNVEFDHFSGLTVDFAQRREAKALVRGLRVMSDFEFEMTMAINNHKLNAEIDTVILMPSEQYLFLSSRLVKEIVGFGGKVSHYVTPEVEQRLLKKLGRA